MVSSDATAIPIKNQAYRVTFCILDGDGDLIPGAAGLDSEISKDGGTFTDVTAEATEIATASGMYYLDLTQTEMNADTVALIIKTTTTGAKTTPIVLYPAETTDIPVNVAAIGGVVQSATDLKDFADDGYDPATNKIAGVVLADTTTTNTDMRGTDSANTTVPDAAGVAATPSEVNTQCSDAIDNNPTIVNINNRTYQLDTDWANGGRLDLILDIIAVDTTTDIPALIATAQADLDTITGADGVTLATLQGLYAPNTVVPDVAGTLATYDPPTNTEMVAAFTEVKGATWSGVTDTLEHIRNKQTDIEADTTGLNGDVMRGTDSAALASVCTDARLGELDSANLPTDVSDVKTDTAAILVDTTGLNGDAMRGTDGANTTIPDVAGTAAGLHTTTDALVTTVDGVVDTILADTNELQLNQGNWLTATSVTVSDKTGFSLSAAGIDDILDETIEGTHSLREMMRLFASMLVGKVSGGGTATITFRDIDDSKNRIVMTVTDVGNRTAVVLTED